MNRSSASTEREFSVKTTLYRELLEELFDRSEYDQHGESPRLDPEDEPEIRRLLDLRSRGEAELLYAGISVNLLSLRPEICTLLLVHDPDWVKGTKLGLEYARQRDQLPEGRHRLTSLSLDSSLNPVHVGSELRNWALIPNAAAAIQLAIPVARARLAQR